TLHDFSRPCVYKIYKDKLYATAYDGWVGDELFVLDTNTIPKVVKDLYPGIKGGFTNLQGHNMVELNGILYFEGNNGITGEELYRFDGNSISLEKDINPGKDGSFPYSITELNGKLYFSAFKPGYGGELCMYDPVTKKDTIVADIVPGTKSSII